MSRRRATALLSARRGGARHQENDAERQQSAIL